MMNFLLQAAEWNPLDRHIIKGRTLRRLTSLEDNGCLWLSPQDLVILLPSLNNIQEEWKKKDPTNFNTKRLEIYFSNLCEYSNTRCYVNADKHLLLIERRYFQNQAMVANTSLFATADVRFRVRNARMAGNCDVTPLFIFTQQAQYTFSYGQCRPFCSPLMPCVVIRANVTGSVEGFTTNEVTCDCSPSLCSGIGLHITKNAAEQQALHIEICDLEARFHEE